MPTMAELFSGGFEAGQDLGRKRRAFAEAENQFGPQAGDPGLFSALQVNEAFPADQARKDAFLKIQQGQEDRAIAREPGSQARLATAEDRAQETHNATVGVKEEERRKKATLGMLNGLLSARESGKPMGEAFDQFLDILPVLGVDPEDIPEMRDSLIEDPSRLDDLIASLSDPEDVKGGATQAASDKAAKQERSRGDVTDVIGQMREHYAFLDEMKAIPSAHEGSTLRGGLSRSLKSSVIGRFIGAQTNTKAEASRQLIEGLRPKLLAAMKSAEDLGAKMFDSEKDMALWLSTLSDTTQPIQTVNELLDTFDRQYGKVLAGQKVTPLTTDDLTAIAPNASTELAEDAPTVIYPGYLNPNTGFMFMGGKWDDPKNWKNPSESTE